MSDAAAPGPTSGDPDDEPGSGADDVPTGEPDEQLVAEAADGAAPEQAAPEGAAPDDPPPTGLPDEALVADAEEPEAGDADPRDALIAELRDELAEVRSDIAEARSGIEAFLPDLAASAREDTLTAGLAGVAREETVAAGNARIQKGLDEMVRLTRRADEHVAELHAENQKLRAGELATATLPMVRDLVRLHDEVARLADASHPEARSDLELVGSRLLDTLARWGLTPFAPEPGEKLDATRHQGVGRVPSADGEPGTIATVRRPGFAHDDGRTFRAAEVEVFQAPPPTEGTPASAPTPGTPPPRMPRGPDTTPADPGAT